MQRKRTLVIEDHVLFKGLLRHVCEEASLPTVVGEAGTGEEGIALARKLQPDLVIVDLRLPDMDGFEVAGAITHAVPASRILAISGYLSPYLVKLAADAPIQGMLDKVSEPLANLITAINTVADGGEYYSETFAGIQHFLKTDGASFMKILSQREQYLMRFFGRGDSNEVIARNLRLSPKTVQTHRHNIMKKLAIRDTPSLMKYARSNGFTVFDDPC